MCNDLLYKKWKNLYKITQNTIYTNIGLDYLSKKYNFKTISTPVSVDINKQKIISFPDNIPKHSIYNFVSVILHIYGKEENHFNIIIINYALKTIERYEPHGYNNIIDTQNIISLLLQKQFMKILPDFIFIPNFSINKSLQVLHNDTQGLCQTYGLFYLYKRLNHNNLHIIDPIKFQQFLISTTKIKNIKEFAIEILCQIFNKLNVKYKKLLLNYNNLTKTDGLLLLDHLRLLNYLG